MYGVVSLKRGSCVVKQVLVAGDRVFSFELEQGVLVGTHTGANGRSINLDDVAAHWRTQGEVVKAAS